jgi:flagellar hook-length control protein FliK
MSLEITSTPSMPSIAPPQGNADQAQVQGDGKTNPFASLLVGLDAVQQPQISAVTETNVPSTSKPLMTPVPMTGELIPDTSGGSIDALKAFMGPAFNSRLSVTQSDELAKSVVTTSLANAASPVPVEMATSLLNLLTAKTQAPVVENAADNIIEQAVVDAAQTVPAEIMSVTVSETLVENIPTETSRESDTDDEAAEIEPVISANLILPVTIEAKPIGLTDTAALANDTDIEFISNSSPISLFDKLSASTRELTEVTNDSSDDVATVEATTADTALPVSNLETNTAAPKVPETAHSAQLQPPEPSVQNDSAAAPRDLPQVTMRPVNEAQMVEGVSVLLARAGKNQVNEFIIRMDPPELGRIEVQMRMSEDGTVQAVIASDNPNTHDLLRREASTIERALNESGFRTGNDGLSFNLKQQSSEQQRRDGEKYPSSAANGGAAPDDNIPTSVFAPLRQRYENARINISA